MPLEHSASKPAIGRNIAREEAAGKPKKQAIAISLNTAREAGAKIPKKKGLETSAKVKELRQKYKRGKV